MNEETGIEKGLPIPPKTVRATRWAQIAEDMVIGDSILVANDNEACGLRTALKIRGKKAAQRKEGGKGGKVRVWMTQDDR